MHAARVCFGASCRRHVTLPATAMAAPPIQRVQIASFEQRAEPAPHVAYVIRVGMAGESWEVQRRYSEFAALHAAISPPAPPAPLPPKNLAAHSLRLLRGIGGLFGASTDQQGMDEAAIEERRAGLELYLRAIVSARDDQWRVHPAFLEFLQVPIPEESNANAPAAQAAATQAATAVRSDPTKPSRPFLPDPATLRPWNAKKPAVETNVTRPLSDAQLLQHQTDTQMRAQDAQAEQLAKILARQKQLGLAIHDELNEQTELLHHLTTDVQNTRTRMDQAQTRMARLE